MRSAPKYDLPTRLQTDRESFLLICVAISIRATSQRGDIAHRDNETKEQDRTMVGV